MAELWLVRHGQSVSNAGLPTGHPSRSALTETGRRQAAYAALALTAAPDRLVVSAYSRAVDTATTRTPRGNGSAVGPLTRVTSAPRRRAARARA